MISTDFISAEQGSKLLAIKKMAKQNFKVQKLDLSKMFDSEFLDKLKCDNIVFIAYHRKMPIDTFTVDEIINNHA